MRVISFINLIDLVFFFIYYCFYLPTVQYKIETVKWWYIFLWMFTNSDSVLLDLAFVISNRNIIYLFFYLEVSISCNFFCIIWILDGRLRHRKLKRNRRSDGMFAQRVAECSWEWLVESPRGVVRPRIVSKSVPEIKLLFSMWKLWNSRATLL